MEACLRALEIDENNAKALIRLALSYENMFEFKKCLLIITKVLKSSIPSQLLKMAMDMQSRIKPLAELDDSCAKMEPGPESLLTATHSLRLNIINGIKRNLERRGLYTVRLCISNEFGLWSRIQYIAIRDVLNQQYRISCRALCLRWSQNGPLDVMRAEESNVAVYGDTTVGEDGKVSLPSRSK